ncbi:MAG: 6-phosphogluconolactonase [Methylotenera sp.]|nr:6-phosphogluconolactonase [Methylotenera sp.]MSP99238.1 6-phosphogluconolactonase [Methylotenera sp.]
MLAKNTRWKLFDSIECLRHGVCDAIVKSANEAIVKRGKFSIVLAGGNTPRAVYRLLRDFPMDWTKWHIYHGDERCLLADHEERNSLMVTQVLLQYVAVPASQVHNIPAELGPVAGANTYAKTLSAAPMFDLVLLGLGEDGHTASLFPNHPIDNSANAVPVFDSPKPPAERITLSQNRLNNTHQVIFIVTGAGKQEAVNQWRKGKAIPATLIAPENGVDVYCYEVELN